MYFFIWLELCNFSLQELLGEMTSHTDDKARLRPLVQELTSDLPADSEEKSSLLQQLSELENEWEKLEQDLRYNILLQQCPALLLASGDRLSSPSF